MRFVFMDEAGTSGAPHEKIRVVAALTVEADEQLTLAETAVNEALGAVPVSLRNDFIFHATDIWNDSSIRGKWSLNDRLALLKNMMRLPRKLNIPLSFGMVRVGTFPTFEPTPKMSSAQFEHFMAYLGCIGRADKFIREHARATEIATLVAEDTDEMRKFLKHGPRVMREVNLSITSDMLLPTTKEQKQGYIEQESDQRVSRIRNTVHFVRKGEEPLVSMADSIAFGLRRFFEGQSHGREFGEAIFGNPPLLEDYRGPSSYVTCRWIP